MKISAVVLAYNRQELLNRTLQCLLNQTMPLHEIIVVDNASRDPLTVPDGVKLIRIEHAPEGGGISAAKNLGAKSATGDWLLFSYDDTLHMLDAVKCIVKRANKLERTRLLINVLTVPVRSEPAMPSEESLYKQASKCDSEMIRATLKGGRGGLCFEQHSGFINRDFFMQIGGYDEKNFKSWGLLDQDLCLTVIRHGGILECDIKRANGQPLFCFHQFNPDQPTSKEFAEIRNAEFRVKYGYNWENAWERRWAHRHIGNKEKTVASFLQQVPAR